MKKIILHIGYPKCASTSLQSALLRAKGLLYPQHGLNLYEHLAFALKLNGLDDWTAQWFTQEWVDAEYNDLIHAVNSAREMVVISSERLAGITPEKIGFLREEFGDVDIEVLMLYRPKDDYVKSMWKHEVFRDDLCEPFEKFRERFGGFDMLQAPVALSGFVKVNLIDISKDTWQSELSRVFGIDIKVPNENVSASFQCCEFLQRIHVSVGSLAFKKYFTEEGKQRFSDIFVNSAPNKIDDFKAPIF
jgi:hypothetical protein